MDVVVTEEVDKGQAYVHRDSNVCESWLAHATIQPDSKGAP